MPGQLAPRQQNHLVHLASYMPFQTASRMMEELLEVQVSKESARRLTQRMGDALQQAQTEAADAPFEEEADAALLPSRLAMSADGAMIGLVGGEWVEVRTLVLGQIAPPEKKTCTPEPRVQEVSSFSRLVDAEGFIHLAEVETRRRKVIQAGQVCAVMDGAQWLQEFTDVHRADAVRILDFAHAADHVSALLEALGQQGLQFPPKFRERCWHLLKHRGPQWMLKRLDRLPESMQALDGIREHVGYLRKREAQMQYRAFLKEGLPIGSGMVESANKSVVEARLKGAGMRWQRKNVNSMLALRNGACSDRWQATWREATAAVLLDQQRSHQNRADQRAQSRLGLRNPLLLTSPALPPPPPPDPPSLPSPVPAPAKRLPGSSRPSASHPWRRPFKSGPLQAQKDAAKI
ncbi:MAG: hypothetical protein JO011_17165 [Ktedonobacteraceae bacterium]|nr:hypothetical protein [Ktedonobacteraceae bacterium]